jgi:hypothetical protein
MALWETIEANLIYIEAAVLVIVAIAMVYLPSQSVIFASALASVSNLMPIGLKV